MYYLGYLTRVFDTVSFIHFDGMIVFCSAVYVFVWCLK